jgi:hypothetical protein
MPKLSPVSYKELVRFTKPGVIRPVVISRYSSIPTFIIKNNLRNQRHLSRPLLQATRRTVKLGRLSVRQTKNKVRAAATLEGVSGRLRTIRGGIVLDEPALDLVPLRRRDRGTDWEVGRATRYFQLSGTRVAAQVVPRLTPRLTPDAVRDYAAVSVLLLPIRT